MLKHERAPRTYTYSDDPFSSEGYVQVSHAQILNLIESFSKLPQEDYFSAMKANLLTHSYLAQDRVFALWKNAVSKKFNYQGLNLESVSRNEPNWSDGLVAIGCSNIMLEGSYVAEGGFLTELSRFIEPGKVLHRLYAADINSSNIHFIGRFNYYVMASALFGDSWKDHLGNYRQSEGKQYRTEGFLEQLGYGPAESFEEYTNRLRELFTITADEKPKAYVELAKFDAFKSMVNDHICPAVQMTIKVYTAFGQILQDEDCLSLLERRMVKPLLPSST